MVLEAPVLVLELVEVPFVPFVLLGELPVAAAALEDLVVEEDLLGEEVWLAPLLEVGAEVDSAAGVVAAVAAVVVEDAAAEVAAEPVPLETN